MGIHGLIYRSVTFLFSLVRSMLKKGMYGFLIVLFKCKFDCGINIFDTIVEMFKAFPENHKNMTNVSPKYKRSVTDLFKDVIFYIAHEQIFI